MAPPKDQITKILLVEDEALIRMATAAMLEDEGYQVLEGTDAINALTMLDSYPDIDIVITDVQMPGKIDGLELVEIIRRQYPHILTLITSGRASLNETQQSGAKMFLEKPYTARAIQSAVQEVLTTV